MLRRSKGRCAAVLGAAALSLGAAAPASAQQEGLVNVNVSGVTAQVPIGIAANLCDVSAAVLAGQGDVGPAECDASAESIATRGPGGGAAADQEGLVNVNISDVTVQVPVSVAANICDLNVAVLAEQLDVGEATCTATAESLASRGPGAGGRNR